MRACAFFLFLSLALHGGRLGGSFLHRFGASPTDSSCEPRPRSTSREVDDMRARMIVGTAAAALAASPAFGVDRLVPSKQYPTIQSAVNAAADGDIIVIAAGTFTETVQLGNKRLTVRGAGATQTIWRAPAGATCIPPQPENTKPISLVDIGFADCNLPTYPNAAVALNWVAPHVVRRCAFINCTFFALNIWGSGSLVEDCDFIGTVDGIAVNTNLSSAASPHVFRNCRFKDNRYGDVGSAMDIYQSNVRLESCTFTRNNFPSGNGLAIRSIASNLFLSNTRFCESGPSPILGGWTDGGGNTFTTATCAPPCPADIIRDATVNGADLAIILVAWGTSGSQYPGADLDGNRVVNGSDLAAVLAAWGPCPQ
ncbi:MAG: hypothetical protein NTU45_08235 [Planctomycetota bacterium]|nr:hypothetical protein [Planctomycetota bacterium]